MHMGKIMRFILCFAQSNPILASGAGLGHRCKFVLKNFDISTEQFGEMLLVKYYCFPSPLEVHC